MLAADYIEHHQSIIEEIDRMTKEEILAKQPRMNQISVIKVKDDGTHTYDLRKFKGKRLLTIPCCDGIVFIVQEDE